MVARFRIGAAYIGTQTADNSRKKIFQVIGRQEATVSMMVVQVSKVDRPEVKLCDGKEYAIVRDAAGVDFFVSASVPIDVDAAFAVAEMCKA